MNRELWKLAVQGLARKKRSAFLLFSVLLLSFAFAIIALFVTDSIAKTNAAYRDSVYGTWYGAISAASEEDGAFLRKHSAVTAVGCCVTYGRAEQAAVGTADEVFLTLGQIETLDGQLPQTADEIAVEADTLSALGYDYELGQQIELPVTFSVGERQVTVTQTYRLCGVLREYTDIWQTPRKCNSILLLPEAAQLLRFQAEELAAELVDESGTPLLLSPDPPTLQYFFTLRSGSEEAALEEINDELSDGLAADQSHITVNMAAAQQSQNEAYSFLYAALILLVTLLAVVCIYIVQLRDQVRRLSTFRSIGITKRQLRWMLFYETLLLCLPAMLLGTLLGCCGTWAVLRLSVYSGSVPIQVSVAPPLLAAAVAVWMVSVLLARLLVFQLALRAPLTVRTHMAQGNARRLRAVRRILIAALSALFCGTVIFAVLEVQPYLYHMGRASRSASYIIYHDPLRGNRGTITREQAQLLRQVPGIRRVEQIGLLHLELDAAGIAGLPLAQEWQTVYSSLPEYSDLSAEGLPVSVLILDQEDWADTIDFTGSGIDMDKFRSGDEVLLSFPQNMDGRFYAADMDKGFDSCGIQSGDTITLRIPGETPSQLEVTVGGIHCFTPSMDSQLLSCLYQPFTVIASEPFLQRILAQLEIGQTLGSYRGGESLGYYRLDVYADINAGFLSTDWVMASICDEQLLQLHNNREALSAVIQENVQAVILLLSGSGCIALVLLLILGNTLTLEAQEEKRSYGILQALGLSRREMRRWIGRAAALRALAALGCGGLLYACYVLLWAAFGLSGGTGSYWQAVQSKLTGLRWWGVGWEHIAVTGLLCFAVLLLIGVVSKRRLFRDAFQEGGN